MELDARDDRPDTPEPEYQLYSFRDFRRFLIEADIKLVRPEFLRQLHQAGEVWPRCQEAELLPRALYMPREDEDFATCSVSHCWEAREHPDPCGFQLAQIVLHMDREEDFCGDVCSKTGRRVYFFIDFLSLYQYKRSSPGHGRQVDFWGLCFEHCSHTRVLKIAS